MTLILQLGWIFLSAFGIGFSGAMMPGPLLAVTIGEASRRGAWAGPLLILGHAILELVLVVGIARGMVSFLENRVLFGCIGLAGGGVLLWMGIGMVRSARTLSLSNPEAGATRMHPVLAGIVLSVSNPYWILWWITIGSGYVIAGLRFGVLGLAVFFAGHILSDLVWYTLVSVGIARGKSFISDRVYRRLITVCGVGLMVFGLWFVHTGVTTLR